MQLRAVPLRDPLQLDELSQKLAGQYARALNIDSCFLLVQNQKLIGMACLEDFGNLDKPIACRSYVLHDFVIFPSERKKGYGTFFFREICKQLNYYAKTCRIEWLIGGNSLPFWKQATQNQLHISPWCGREDCDCQHCCEGFPAFHMSCYDEDFAVFVLKQDL